MKRLLILVLLVSILLIVFRLFSTSPAGRLDIYDAETGYGQASAQAEVTEYSYGTHPKETLDVYLNTQSTTPAPIIVMVHGGGWQIGDKGNSKVVTNKLNYWSAKGYLFVSINYPMIPEGYAPDTQAKAVADALVYIQKNAEGWGGNPNNIIVMGHSAGAHLVALVSTTKTKYPALMPWKASVLLDSAVYDVTASMTTRPSKIYQEAFGEDQTFWKEVSPLLQATAQLEPHFIVCSSKRAPAVCGGANTYANTLIKLDTDATVYEVPLSHEDINQNLGLPSEYTEEVSAFIELVLSK